MSWSLLAIGSIICPALSQAQFGRGDALWSTAGKDAQRSSWVRTDPKLSKLAVQQPDFRFLWKLKLSDEPSQPNPLVPAVLIDKYIGYRGFRSFAFVGGVGNNIYALDSDMGRVEWKTHLTTNSPQAGHPQACSSVMLTNITHPVNPQFPVPAPPRVGPGRAGPAHSGVGEANEGAATIAQAGTLRLGGAIAPTPAAAAATAAASGPGTPPGAVTVVPPVVNPALLRPPVHTPNFLYGLSSDGAMHLLYVSNGMEPDAPIPFLPPNSNPGGLIVINNIAYATTSPGCGESGSALWALDLVSKQVSKWDSKSEIIGAEGPAFGPDGTVYVVTKAGELMALDPKTLQVKDTFTSKDGFTSSPLVFAYRQRTLIAVAGKGGRIYLFNSAALNGVDNQGPVYVTPASLKNGDAGPAALASWQDNGGVRWILAPVQGPVSSSQFKSANGNVAGGAIAAWRIAEEDAGSLTLQPAWMSHDIAAPLSPMLIGGMVFTASSGATTKGAKRSSGAVIYALDSATGKELWNSGKTISSPAREGALSAGGSQIYLGADDGTLFAFGSWIER